MTYQAQFAAQEPARAELDAMPGAVLLEFGAPWCGHCRAAQPALQALLAAREGLTHLKVEDGRGKPLGRAFGVKLWPTLVLLRAGEEQARVVRPLSREDLAPLGAALDASS
ncbi:thioredoxin family protein [Luteimonas viscosa]|nr:thioredoxin family protein [Luteimonas viscosa]